MSFPDRTSSVPLVTFQVLETGVPVGGDEPVPAARQESVVQGLRGEQEQPVPDARLHTQEQNTTPIQG